MTKKKNFKTALVMAILSLIVCLSMFAGTTFAWFTDSVTSSGNIIASGTLDVTMSWAKSSEAVPTTDAGWTDASAGAIFNSEKWEPGYTEARHIKISNVGTLALKYKINILAEGEVSDIAKVIDVYYADPAVQIANRASLSSIEKIGTLDKVLAGLDISGNGELKEGESDTVTLVLKMQENAGNEYMDKKIGPFSVQLVATQLASESDSFGDDYDEGAVVLSGLGTKEAPYTVANAAQLALISENIKNGVAPSAGGTDYASASYKLTSDIDLAGQKWTPIGSGANPFNGSFDGNNKTISNVQLDYTNADASSLVDNGRTLVTIFSALVEMGYHLEWMVLNSK